MEGWAKYWCPVLKSCLFQNGDRIPVSVLADLRARSDAYQKLVPPSTLFLDALKDLDAAVDRLELEKFEKALIETPDMAGEGSNELKSNGATTDVNPEIWKALKEAQDHLHGAGQFDPKKAADLLRSSLDETHRVLVHEMEKITGKQYQGGEKDGARRQYLRDIGFISLPEEKFLTAIYALISEEASHKLIAPRETVFVLLTTVRGFIQLLSKRLHDRKVPTG